MQVATPSARRIARWWPGPHAWWRLEVAARTAGLAAIAVFFVHRGLLHAHLSAEHLAFWGVRDGVLYEAPWLAERTGGPIPFVYSPAFAQAIAPLAALPLAAFAAAWMGLQLAALVWLAGPVLAGVLVWTFFPLWATNLWAGAIYIPTAAALAIALRYPGAWSFLLLTRVTPGVGMLWHAVRREWRQFGVAAGTTALIAGISFLIAPRDWSQWIGLLRDSTTASPGDVPLALRLSLAAAIVVLAAWRDWRYLLPVGVLLSVPQLGWSATPLLLASIYWWRTRPDRLSDDRPSRGRTSERDLPWPRSLAFRPDLGGRVVHDVSIQPTSILSAALILPFVRRADDGGRVERSAAVSSGGPCRAEAPVERSAASPAGSPSWPR
ncbi:MAG: DUF2029 domain-containing protein [Chloroflexi bacterium]|nr:DUF2029 domain-containing protein [Chloroflexota bacterium]